MPRDSKSLSQKTRRPRSNTRSNNAKSQKPLAANGTKDNSRNQAQDNNQATVDSPNEESGEQPATARRVGRRDRPQAEKNKQDPE
jgi:hypothetical protein